MVGRTLNSRYQLEELIGTGGMADVYRATDNLLGRTVAVKILHPQFAKDPVFIARFRQEAQAAANLNQPNIVNVYDWGIEEGTYYLVMEFVEGRDLKDIIVHGGALMPERAVEISISICGALDAAAAAGIVHRDIKPQNIIVTFDNQIKVMDFGIARTAGGSAMTQTGTIMGTAQYISPEQAQGRAADPRSDLYSLGVVLYEMLTGKVPFDGENPVSIAYKHVREDPLPPSMVNPDVSPELEAVVMKAMAKNPQNRYQSAREMKSDLERLLEGGPVSATPVLAPEEAAGATMALPAARGGGRSRAWIWIVVIVVLLLLIGGGVYAIVRSTGGISVPDVVGKKQDEARRLLEEQGLTMKVASEVVDTTRAKDVIVSQDPASGAKAEKGTVVEVVVSKGPEMVAVPNLLGLSQSEAQAACEAQGLKLDQVSQSFTAQVEKGKVMAQSPDASTQVPKGSAVNITLSKGAEMVLVPDVMGQAKDAAVQAITQAGLTPEVREETSSTATADTVTAQDPTSGANVPKGSTVTITVAKAPVSVTVPSVVGELKADAENTLVGAGLDVTVINQTTSDPTKVGKVITQDPAGGASAHAGDTVKIYVGVSP
ncbi:MAG: Stk1 family PASTA domain-containing Ser/Thr kinase [Actinobacteria bacterium]|nr:Stk1 family PASTA domain-containing Ser/Thr kinase [Actinomycetota bacterium]MBU1944373.1 Stk1 family PASTA domain-containing Ser/Thr kinase [Actinomycetota bacterium]MBU2688172.1 Stk1 family PASTA domain-containing Ser/Thr kinase [Actinomycetota bacterium]